MFVVFFFFSSRRRHTRLTCDWSSDVCSSDLDGGIHFLRPARVVTHIDPTGLQDPESGDFTFDGVTGARDGSFPTVDVANGAPTGAGATDEIVLAWSNGP